MRTAGITGGIGSGKTTVCKIFELLGIPVFYADEEAKKLYTDSKIKSKTVKLFGKKILRGKEIDKKKLAQIVFEDKTALKKLNSVIHPAVKAKFNSWKKKQKKAAYVIKEAAIMVESGSHKDLDFLISVRADEQTRIERVSGRDNVPFSEVEKRLKEQLSDKEREKYADAVIVNDGSRSLIHQVLEIHHKLSE